MLVSRLLRSLNRQADGNRVIGTVHSLNMMKIPRGLENIEFILENGILFEKGAG